MNVGVDPACTDIVLTAEIDAVPGRAAQLAKRRYFAVNDGDIRQRIVHLPRTAQE